MKGDLDKNVAIVTGGAKGYGAGIAEVLKSRNADVWITGRDEAALRETEKRLGVHAVKADVTSGADWTRLFETVLKEAEEGWTSWSITPVQA